MNIIFKRTLNVFKIKRNKNMTQYLRKTEGVVRIKIQTCFFFSLLWQRTSDLSLNWRVARYFQMSKIKRWSKADSFTQFENKLFWFNLYSQNYESNADHRGIITRGENWLLWKGPTVCHFICVLCHNFWSNYDLDLFSTSKWPSDLQFCERYKGRCLKND